MKIVTEGLKFPEGPVAMNDGSIVLVEIGGECITRVAPDGSKTKVADVPGGPNGLALGGDGNFYVCNNGGFEFRDDNGCYRPVAPSKDYETGRIEVVNPKTGELSRLYEEVNGKHLRGPNDIVFDHNEGFWFTDLGKSRSRDRDHGGLYWAAADGSHIVEAAYPIPGGGNGVGLSPDGKTVYVAETETGRLWAWDVIGPGRLKKRPWPSPHGGYLVIQMPGYRRLDSLAVAASGNIVVATLIEGEINTISPEGSVVDVRKMPDIMPTNICFGGEDLETAWITLSTSGRLLKMQWREPGLKLKFAG
ncbi:Gluconolactonase [Pseudomonas sp. AD21]|uniref:SMP-30/gluconolactonase/LRE family protein n=1 Tax=Pseudomonas sp. AD21 TaxID=396378 RepID=UPI000C8642BA|nr:SMP-30/gluconolactonase/LRE family protein [Pseudomonas sp. AD21]PMQ11573.1 Gluconolactonase [Pseudomonas sp. AD21]